jgi:hypothetical protein
VLRGWAALASRAVVVNDIERHRVPWVAIKTLARLSRSPLFGDGSLRTVLRGFTPVELNGLAATAGLARWRVTRHFPFRLTLVGQVGTGAAR